MNKFLLSVLFLILTGIITAQIYGQKKEITEERFLQTYNLMIANVEKQSRRVKLISEHFETDSRIKFEPQEVIVEFSPPDRIYLRSVFGNRVNEKIYIGNIEFKKQNGTWFSKEIDKPQTIPFFKPLLSQEGVKRFLTDNVSINGKEANLLEVVKQTNYQQKNQKTQEIETFSILVEQKYWVSKENLLLKEERIESHNRPQANNFKFVYEYEYDLNIKIEEPIIKGETKSK